MSRFERFIWIMFALLVMLKFHLAAYRRIDLRQYVGSKVVMLHVHRGPRIAQGTGFHVQGSSGDVYIVTNRHVCELSLDGKVEIVEGRNETPKKILIMDPKWDLCLLEGQRGAGLHLADRLWRGEEVAILGHPAGLDLAMTQGEIIGFQQMNLDAPLRDPADRQKCLRWKNNSIQIIKDEDGHDLVVCRSSEPSIATTAQIEPGSSGSPMVNQQGEVVGVAFCNSSEDFWARTVPLRALQGFLKGR